MTGKGFEACYLFSSYGTEENSTSFIRVDNENDEIETALTPYVVRCTAILTEKISTKKVSLALGTSDLMAILEIIALREIDSAT
ncbi:hypothetical protein [Bacillus siamensis]|uniref:hypothetical protein n=1 Tax=Bacillus siamensis TaxID=659243 RepID=UPI0022B779DC|nr:hypothetical protein [Bacillus siamensis]